jgi:CBS domain-containing protein
MTENHISHMPVLENGKLVGILSFHDVAKKALKDASFENTLLKQYIKNWPAAQ